MKWRDESETVFKRRIHGMIEWSEGGIEKMKSTRLNGTFIHTLVLVGDKGKN